MRGACFRGYGCGLYFGLGLWVPGFGCRVEPKDLCNK